VNGHPTVFDATDKEFHKKRRRILSPAFSVLYISSMEPLMHTATERVILKIKDEILKANAEGHEFAEIDLWRILQHFAIVCKRKKGA
jgi:cytochrome P450